MQVTHGNRLFLTVKGVLLLCIMCGVLSGCVDESGLPEQMVIEETFEHDFGSTPGKAYFVYSNTSSSATTTPIVSGKTVYNSGNEEIANRTLPETSIAENSVFFRKDLFDQNDLALPRLEYSTNNLTRNQLEIPKPLFDTVAVGDTMSFNIYEGSPVSAICKKVVTNSSNGKNLVIWIEQAESGAVTQPMIDALADAFLKTSGSDDIYSWITHIYGEEWGSHSYSSQLIADNDTITILLLDIDNDGLNGNVAGYFYPRDCFLQSRVADSNQRMMFYIDSWMLRQATGGTWEITDSYPAMIVLTLAHEFQHMIHYYQKSVLRAGGKSSATWLNEMCSMVAEDAVAKNLSNIGPRGVSPATLGSAGSWPLTSGDLPLFVAKNYLSLTDWQQIQENYSMVYAYGSFLARNFGGGLLFRNIVQSGLLSDDAVVSALSSMGYSYDFGTTMQLWGKAVLLSDITTLSSTSGYRFNSGDWIADSLGYSFGSINMFNYYYGGQAGPKVYTASSDISSLYPTSNLLYLAGENLTGKHNWQVSHHSTVKVMLVTK